MSFLYTLQYNKIGKGEIPRKWLKLKGEWLEKNFENGKEKEKWFFFPPIILLSLETFSIERCKKNCVNWELAPFNVCYGCWLDGETAPPDKRAGWPVTDDALSDPRTLYLSWTFSRFSDHQVSAWCSPNLLRLQDSIMI